MILVMFDMDGALVDMQALVTEHMAATFLGVGREVPTTEQSRRVISDTTLDIEMGVAARCKTAGVTWGYHEPRELIAMGASTMIGRFDQLDGAIRQLVE